MPPIFLIFFILLINKSKYVPNSIIPRVNKNKVSAITNSFANTVDFFI